MKKETENKIFKRIWKHQNQVVRVDVDVTFRKKAGGTITVPAKKILSIEELIRKSIRKGYNQGIREKKE